MLCRINNNFDCGQRRAAGGAPLKSDDVSRLLPARHDRLYAADETPGVAATRQAKIRSTDSSGYNDLDRWECVRQRRTVSHRGFERTLNPTPGSQWSWVPIARGL